MGSIGVWYRLTVLAELYLAGHGESAHRFARVDGYCGYLFGYTPLKTKTSLQLGRCISGGGAAVDRMDGRTRRISMEAWVLFAIWFCGSFHTFWLSPGCIEKTTRAPEYDVTGGEPEGGCTGQQIVIYTLMPLARELAADGVGRFGKVYFSERSSWVYCFYLAVFVLRLSPSRRRPDDSAGLGYLSAAFVHSDGGK